MSTPEIFESFVEANYDSVRRSLVLAVGNADRAEELAQEAFVRALAHWSSVSVMERPVAWVYVVAMNKARRDLRRDRYRVVLPSLSVANDVAAAVTTSLSLSAALASLAPRQRAVVVLRYLADLSVEETARAMRCAEGTVKSSLHSALAQLRVEMEDDFDLAE